MNAATSVVELVRFQSVGEILEPGGEMIGIVDRHLSVGDPHYGDGDAAASADACPGSPVVVRIGRSPEDATTDPVIPHGADRQAGNASQKSGIKRRVIRRPGNWLYG